MSPIPATRTMKKQSSSEKSHDIFPPRSTLRSNQRVCLEGRTRDQGLTVAPKSDRGCRTLSSRSRGSGGRVGRAFSGRMPKKKPTKVYRYDGQSIWTSPDSGYSSYSDYELGSFLGGGAAGVVYEAECFKTKRHLAVKVLNPIGYKLAPNGSLRFCEVVSKGVPYGDGSGQFGGRESRVQQGLAGGGRGGNGGAGKMSEKHVWWLVNPSTKQIIAAYFDLRTGMLKEMTLPKCIEVWGLGDDKGRRGGRSGARARGKKDRERDRMRQEDRIDKVFVGGEWLSIPSAPAKYDKFLRARASIFREISNMLQLTEHPNILRLHEALELVQDSKATIFLVLELARGGELFDRIKVDCGADEGAARHYFRQLLSGVQHCHDRGVCHRDLKPENLLLADPDDSSVLKIADFGFSALFRELESESSSGDDSSGPTPGIGGGGVVGVGVGLGAPPLRRPPSGLSLGGRTRTTPPAGARGRAGGGGGGGGGGRGVRRLTSVVGSPYYVAPEVLREESGDGYDGTKADVWSMGVILYAMLAGSLPFEKELLACTRFAKFGAWARQTSQTASLRAHCSGNPKDATDMDSLDYPAWFYPQHFSYAARSLLSGLLHPDASNRLSVRQALRHPWVLDGKLYTGSGGSSCSSSDGSELGVGGGCVDDDARTRAPAPDPHDIPSELLGADSDVEEEGEDAVVGWQRGRTEHEEARDEKAAWLQHEQPHQRCHPKALGHPPVAEVVAATPRRTGDGGGGGNAGGGTAVAEAFLSKTVVAPAVPAVAVTATMAAAATAAAAKLGGIVEEDTALTNQVEATFAAATAVVVTDGERETTRLKPEEEGRSPPEKAAPPPLPPPPPQATAIVRASSSSSTSDTAHDIVGVSMAEAVTEPQSVDSEVNVQFLRDRVSAMSLVLAGQSVKTKGDEKTGCMDGAGMLDKRERTPRAGKGRGEDAAAVTNTGSDANEEIVSAVAVAVATAGRTQGEAAARTASEGGQKTMPSSPSSSQRQGAQGSTGHPFSTPRKTGSPRPLDVFSSPPLAPVGSGKAVQEGESEFSLDAGPAAVAPERARAKDREGLPPSGLGHAAFSAGGAGATLRPLLGAVERPLSLGIVGGAAGAGSREGGVVAAAPPAFHDLVKRSTRFMTSVPAAVVLRKIAAIINADAHPLPYPYRNIKQKAVVHQDAYTLEIMRGGVLVCTVQIYLLGGEQRAAQYMVEFLRGQLDIFLFKRFYEDVRCKLNDLVKKDYSLALLESGTCTHRLRRFSNLA